MDDESEVFSTRLAALPNELFDIIINKLEVHEIVSLWTYVGTRLFTNNVSKTVMTRIYRLRARYCENLTWDKKYPEDSLFILWSLCLQNCVENDDRRTKLYRIMKQYEEPERYYHVCPDTFLVKTIDQQQTQLTILKSKDSVKSWKFSNGLMWIGKASRSPNEIVSKFLKAKSVWLMYRIVIEKRLSGNKNMCIIELYKYFNLYNNYSFEVVKSLIITDKIMCIIKCMVESGEFQVTPRIKFNYTLGMMLRPRIIMNFNVDPISPVYQHIFDMQHKYTNMARFCYSVDSTIQYADLCYRSKKKITPFQRLRLKNAKEHINTILTSSTIGDGLFCSMGKYISTSLAKVKKE
jgi:hypothetical protein